jgi:galactonate dehydratase
MKIRSVQALHVGQFLYARIETDTGIVGFGEAGVWGHIDASRTALTKFAEYLVGQDPRRIEFHWNVMQRFAHFRGAAINGAISAIDIALWDIAGKHHGVPVWQLIGGMYRERIRVYGHVYAATVDDTVADCKAIAAKGFTALGHLNPFLDEDEDDRYFKTHATKLRDAVENVRRFREAVGDGVDLLIELHRRLTVAEAIALAREIEQYRPMWLEDPLRPELYTQTSEVGARTCIPIATGERFVSPFEFHTQLERGGVRYARASIGECGGITGGLKIAAIAEVQGVELAPHNPLSPVSLGACMQLATAVSNFAIQEYPTGFENHQLKTGSTLLGADVVDHVPEVKDGFLDAPTRPGIGVNVLDDAPVRRPPVSKKVSMRLHRDGSPVDQ